MGPISRIKIVKSFCVHFRENYFSIEINDVKIFLNGKRNNGSRSRSTFVLFDEESSRGQKIILRKIMNLKCHSFYRINLKIMLGMNGEAERTRQAKSS